MLKVYGSRLCPDCVRCCQELHSAGCDYEYLDFSEDLRYLKEFLALRDTHSVFAEIKQVGKIGIPCIVDDGGSVWLDWSDFM